MANYFPQLHQGVSTQLPLKKALSFRTIVNAQDVATPHRAADPGAKRVAWWLKLRGLDDAEIGAIETAFRDSRGPFGSFVFLDPEANLLKHSEQFSADSWVKSAGLGIAAAGDPPAAVSLASRLTASAVQAEELYQSLDLPCGYRWLASVFARADSPASLTLFVRSSHGEVASSFTLSPGWQRLSLGGVFWPDGTGFDVGVRLAASQTADIAGFQLESQLAPSAYKRSGVHGGVYENARFAQQSLRVTTLAPNCHQVNLTITAPIPG